MNYLIRKYEVLLVYPNSKFLSYLQSFLDDFCTIKTAKSLNQATSVLRNHSIDVVISGVHLDQKQEGIQLMKWVSDFEPDSKFIFCTNHAEELKAVGEYSYIDAQLLDSRLAELNLAALIAKQSRDRQITLSNRAKYFPCFSLLGSNPVRFIEKLVRRKSHFGISGETGTGKMKLIEYYSFLKQQPLFVADFSSMPVERAWEILDGTSNEDDQALFEKAKNGILYLRNIEYYDRILLNRFHFIFDNDETPFITTRRKQRPITAQIIMSSQCDYSTLLEKEILNEAMALNFFGVSVKLPPLRERIIDVLFYFRYFLTEFSGKGTIDLSLKVQEFLLNQSWTGNIREVSFCAQRMAALGYLDEIEEVCSDRWV